MEFRNILSRKDLIARNLLLHGALVEALRYFYEIEYPTVGYSSGSFV